MKNSHRTIKIIFFIIILINIVFPFVQKVQALNEIDDPMYFTPQVGIGTEVQVGEKIKIDEWTFVNYVVAIYDWSIKAIVLLAIVMIMYAGFKWMMAGGNASSITKARDQIISALIGLVLAIGSYTLLNFINPSLVRFRELSPTNVNRRELEIDMAEGCRKWGKEECQDIYSHPLCWWDNASGLCLSHKTKGVCGDPNDFLVNPVCCIKDQQMKTSYGQCSLCGIGWEKIDDRPCVYFVIP